MVIKVVDYEEWVEDEIERFPVDKRTKNMLHALLVYARALELELMRRDAEV